MGCLLILVFVLSLISFEMVIRGFGFFVVKMSRVVFVGWLFFVFLSMGCSCIGIISRYSFVICVCFVWVFYF